MKKILTILVFCAVFLVLNSSVHAKIISKPMFQTTHVRFTSQPEHKDVDNIDICVINPIGGTKTVAFDVTEKSSLCGEKSTILTAVGLYVNFQNKGTAPAVISWKNSSISARDKIYGIPFLDGMKCVNAGNPSFTPDTIIAPGQKVTVRAFLPDLTFYSSSGWHQNGVSVEYGKDFNMILVLSVNGKLVTFNTPGINYIEKI